MNCETLSFSQKLSDQRINRAEALLGRKVVQKILAYALFLLGVSRSAIASFLNIPPGSVRSLILATNNRGLSGFEDQRIKTSYFKPPLPEKITLALEVEESFLRVNFNIGDLLLRIPNSNPIQKRVVLLSMANSGLLERNEVANALGLSADRTGKLECKGIRAGHRFFSPVSVDDPCISPANVDSSTTSDSGNHHKFGIGLRCQDGLHVEKEVQCGGRHFRQASKWTTSHYSLRS